MARRDPHPGRADHRRVRPARSSSGATTRQATPIVVVSEGDELTDESGRAAPGGAGGRAAPVRSRATRRSRARAGGGHRGADGLRDAGHRAGTTRAAWWSPTPRDRYPRHPLRPQGGGSSSTGEFGRMAALDGDAMVDVRPPRRQGGSSSCRPSGTRWRGRLRQPSVDERSESALARCRRQKRTSRVASSVCADRGSLRQVGGPGRSGPGARATGRAGRPHPATPRRR